ncbi:hypothetical protein, unknown function [Leishmania tarentolae]|uniref:Uncharacterized protein n=1 Tax=Leishmania tarentolae TaxID=5689 RepID=A0A640KPD9_LEITA|nr:hypothetical protein, unknown function [Leishmania tarentolae]
MFSVSHDACPVNAATSENVTPLLSTKNLPEAISLTNTPGRAFSAEVSMAEYSASSSSVPRSLPFSPSGISSEVYTSSHRTASRQRSSSSEAQVGVTPGLVHEIDIVRTARYEKGFPDELDTPTAQLWSQSHGEPQIVEQPSPHPIVAERPTLPSPRHASKSAHLKAVRASGVKSERGTAQSALLPLNPLRKDVAKQPLGVFPFQTASTPAQDMNPPPCEHSRATQQKSARDLKVPQTLDHSDLRSVARSNPHLSVLADLVDKKVFSEEDVLLELEAIRKRSLLTSAPFNKRLLPILAWYLLRDKFGDEAATRYVALLTAPAGATPANGAVRPTHTIASFLPRVNEIRRVRREVKEKNRKTPIHHYVITPPASPTKAAKRSNRKDGRGERRTATFDALEDASDLPTATTANPLSPHSCNTPSSPCVRNRSPVRYDRLHVYTREQVAIDRQEAKTEDRPVVDVMVDVASREGRVKNLFEVVEEQASSAVEEPSIFHGPVCPLPRAKGIKAKATATTCAPAPPPSAHPTGTLGEEAVRGRHALQGHGRDASSTRDVTTSIGVFSEVTRSKENEEGLSLFYRECVGGTDHERMPSVSAFWQAITSPDTLAARHAPDRQYQRVKHPKQGGVDGSAGKEAVMGAVTPCVSHILAVTNYHSTAHPSWLASETVNSSQLPTVTGDKTSAQRGVEYSHHVDGDHEWYNAEGRATPEEDPASRTLPSTVAYSALNDPHHSRVGVGHPESTTSTADGSTAYSLLRDACAPEVINTSKQQHGQQLHYHGDTAEIPMHHTVTATEYLTVLPNDSTATHRPECPQESGSEESCEIRSAMMASVTETFTAEGTCDSNSGYGSLMRSHIDIAAISNAEGVSVNEVMGSGLQAVTERSEFLDSKASVMEPSDSSDAQSQIIRMNGTLYPDTSAAAAASFSALESSDTADPTRRRAHRASDTATVSASRLLDSNAHSVPSGKSKIALINSQNTRSLRDDTPAYSSFGSPIEARLSPPSTAIDGSSYAPSAPSGESAFGSFLRARFETSTMCGDHRQNFPLGPPQSTVTPGAPACPHSAKRRDSRSNTSGSSVCRHPCSAYGADRSESVESQHATPPEDSASSLPVPHSTCSRTHSRDSHLSSARATVGDPSSAALGHAAVDSLMLYHPRDQHSRTHCAQAASTHPLRMVMSPTSPHSRTPNTHHSVQARGGYGSMMEGDSAVASGTSLASRSRGEYSIGCRSEPSVQARGGYGSMMEGDSAVASDTSLASRSRGEYSFEDSEWCSGVRGVREVSANGKGSLVLEECAASAMKRCHEEGRRSRSTCGSGEYGPAVSVSIALEDSLPHGAYPSAGEGEVQACSPTRLAANPSQPSSSTAEEMALSACTACVGCGRGSATGSSIVEPDALEDALRRLDERNVSSSKENSACTFGELGCQCGTRTCPMRTTVATSSPSCQPQPVPPSDEGAHAPQFDRLAMRMRSAARAPIFASSDSSPPATVTLQEKSLNTAVPRRSHERKSRVSSAAVSSRGNATVGRVGAGFSIRHSPSPIKGSENASTQRSIPRVSTAAELAVVAGNPPDPTPPSRCKGSSISHTASLLEGDGLRSHVTILADPYSSADISVHHTLAPSTESADTSIQQLGKPECSGTDLSGDRCADRLTITPVSILQNSPQSSRIHDPKRREVETRSQAAAAASSEVSALGDPAVCKVVRERDSFALGSVVGAPLPPETAAVNQMAGASEDESLRMPHDMSAVLFGGAKQPGLFSTTQSMQEDTSHAHDDEEVHQSALAREVHAKHANLITLLCNSRMEASHVANTHSYVLESSALSAGTRLTNADVSKSIGVLINAPTEMEAAVVRETRVDSGDRANELSTTASTHTDESAPSVNLYTTQSTPLAVSIQRRRLIQCPPLQPCNFGRGDQNSREEQQRRRTILDVPGVPYVDSPDISTHIDKREVTQKEKARQLFTVRWARRGLAWQKQENEAQRYEEYQARCGERAVQPISPRVVMMKSSPQGTAALQRPRKRNVSKPPIPMQPRPPGFPLRQWHS